MMMIIISIIMYMYSFIQFKRYVCIFACIICMLSAIAANKGTCIILTIFY